ncbi:hypothetical protein CL614_07620 [archaeon]|nr:hypothetical protein [archaeon]|tara:strand:- start:11885 stop:12313 length:429 start_codon:yes stop_codon:yes gene_type:complete
MKTLENLFAETAKDMPFNDDLIITSKKLPYVYDKYLKCLIMDRLELTRTTKLFKQLYKEKHEYYSGKASKETYQENRFDIKVLRGDLSVYLEADEELAKKQESIDYIKCKIEFLEQTLRNITSKGYACKNLIEWEKLQNGII